MSRVDACDLTAPRRPSASPSSTVCIRPAANVISSMIGPHDHTDRFTYWPVRVAWGGKMLVPVGPPMPVQVIDVRDVADWDVGAVGANIAGAFNLVGTSRALTFGDVLAACIAVASNDPRLRWATSSFPQAHDVGQWVEMPLWLADAPQFAGLLDVRDDRARSTGLRLRPLTDTARDILAENRTRPAGQPLKAGLRPEREELLLDALLSRFDGA